MSMQHYEYAIKGTMILASGKVSALSTLTDEDKDKIRTELITQIANYILEKGLAEFTQMNDSITLDTIVKARCFLVPNDHVKILRLSQEIA